MGARREIVGVSCEVDDGERPLWQCEKKMLSRIGFFHFGSGYGYPVEELVFALDKKGRDAVGNSLIVLPEGFNIRTRHSNPTGPCDFNPSVLRTLRDVAKEWVVVFVAGLIVDTDKHVYPPYNAAYLIDGVSHKLICYKNGGDNSSVENCKQTTPHYTEHKRPCDVNNPLLHSDVSISVLICIDADILMNDDDERYKVLYNRSKTANDVFQIICVPASARFSSFRGFSEKWPNHYVVVSDSGSRLQESFIARGAQPPLSCASGEENKIVLFDLPPKSTDEGESQLVAV